MRRTFILSILIFIAHACEEPKFENARLNIRLTDAPANYEKILIDIRSIEIHYETSSQTGGWTTIENAQTGIYNLLEFRNGKYVSLVSTEITAGKISQIRLILGNNNILVTSKTTHDIIIPSGLTSGLKVNIRDEILYGVEKIIYVDFDVNKSIVQRGNGNYELQPVVRAYSADLTGAIEGNVSPAESNSIISVKVNDNTYETLIDPDGYFCIQGLPTGNYSIDILPEAPYIEKTVSNIEVTNESRSNIGTVVLEKIDNIDFVASTLYGDLNIEPATSDENRFVMQTPTSQIDIDLITSQGDSYTYAGTATEILVMPKAQGATLTIDGIDINLDKSIRYSLKSTDTQMKVNLRNVKTGNGHWWIEISGKNIAITPNPITAK